jgi:hypothetical protein
MKRGPGGLETDLQEKQIKASILSDKIRVSNKMLPDNIEVFSDHGTG